MSILCKPALGTSASSSVHTLRPDDISAVHFLGIPQAHRQEASRVVTRVTELLSMFNPEVVTQHVDQALWQSGNLLEEAEQLSLSVQQQQVTDWRLVLLFVSADSLCACSPNVDAEIEAVVQEVKAALELLQKKLQRTLVHVAIWSTAEQQEDKCECMSDASIYQRLYKGALLKTLLDSLSHVFEYPSEREDFSAELQSIPVIFEQISDSENTWFDPNQLALQLWTNLLQPSTGQLGVIDIPCPTEDRPFLRTIQNSPLDTKQEATVLLDTVMGTEVNCTDRSPSPTVPTSVHEVRPADIKVVAAVGDSLTAANGVGAKSNNILLVLTQYRGLSWSIGGAENISSVTTLPNILKEYNPSVTGYSTGNGNQNSAAAFLNQAVAGATSVDMVGQVEILVNKMKTDTRINFNDDWKVITMFVGGNDICGYCTDSIALSPRNVVLNIQNALDILHQQVPRAIVNLVEMLNVVPLRELHNDSTLGCPTWLVNLLCPCVIKPKEGSVELQKVQEFSEAYQRGMRDLIDSGRYENHPNFTVILQPFMREVYLPRTEGGQLDRSYFAPDCFHLSQKAHTLMARALWNNMFEPVGNKTFSQNFDDGIDFKCPPEALPYFRTGVNSNYSFPGTTPTSPPNTNWGSDFTCVDTAPSDTVPTSVHKLRPGDIKVVGAVGDSLTAGFGAKATNILELRTESRGVSWSIGGDETLETVTTLPNILRKFNPDITGMSTGQGNTLKAGFNMAVSGAKVADIPGQVRRLIDAMKNQTDFQNDWKLVTLFIGGNDLCQYCYNRESLSPKNYSYHMMTSLDMLYAEVPRVLVNVLEILEIEGLRKITSDSLGCSVIKDFICECIVAPPENSPELTEMKRINRDLQDETEKLVYSGRYDDKEDFAVVLQPFFRNTIVPLTADGLPDDTYFSVDCFHFSQQGQADMAAGIWNNMLEPVGSKTTFNDFTKGRNNLQCPTQDHPYIFTKVNSLPVEPPTTPTPTTDPSTHPADCSDMVPVWLAGVLPVIGLSVGCVVTGLLFSCIAKKKKSSVNLKGTGF
ncbi:uncharacterized protein V6R79_008609 [Siganus canaliculatus]